MIQFDVVTFTYPDAERPALKEVNLHISAGQFVLVAGPSGGGKSTLLRCLNGLVPHFSGGKIDGRLAVNGLDPVADGPHILSAVVGFVFQDPEAQFVMDRVEDEIAFALENAGIEPVEMHQRVDEVMVYLDLVKLRNRPLATLSGGEKQKVAIAAALALQPQILVLDEPTSQLDPESAKAVLQVLVRLNKEHGLTVVLAEHRLERILPFVNQMVFLTADKECLCGSPRDILMHINMTPPIIRLAKALAWEPLPLTLEQAIPFARATTLTTPPRTQSSRLGEPLLHIAGLSYAYDGVTALQHIDLDIKPGELVALMGRNGSGKTTLLKCIVGLLNAREGQVMFGGRSLGGREVYDICKEIGYLPQTPDDLLFAESVRDEFMTTLRNHHLLNQADARVNMLLKRLDLLQVADRYPRDLSVGQRQRVALGAITVTRPKLLLLDEPTRGLDYDAKHVLADLMRDWQDEGAAILLTTHDVELAAQVAERVVLLDEGEIIADAAPQHLTALPFFSPQVASLFPGKGWLSPKDVNI
ncbi:MAG: energy-coupling factor transporter ATPase [Anaerolineae bacterium]|nr:energy-coupling factor transporter ATPase [Anaerolineae bacterium]